MTTQKVAELRVEQQRRNLAEHVSERWDVACGDEAGERIIVGRKAEGGRWRGDYYLDYLIIRNRVIVVGDCGAAVYEWGGQVGLAFLATCELDYFASKCTASATGRNGQWWDPDYASACLMEVVAGRGPDALAACGSRFEWNGWLGRHGLDVLGEDYCEFCNIGETEAPTTIIHWLGLKLAHQRLGSAATRNPQPGT